MRATAALAASVIPAVLQLLPLAHAAESDCSGSFMNGTRDGEIYKQVLMNGTMGELFPSPDGCEQLCCGDKKCDTWEYVPASACEYLPCGNDTYCVFKTGPQKLLKTTCDNDNPGCISCARPRPRSASPRG